MGLQEGSTREIETKTWAAAAEIAPAVANTDLKQEWI